MARKLVTNSGQDNLTLVQRDGSPLDVQLVPDSGGGGGGSSVASIKFTFGPSGAASVTAVPAGDDALSCYVSVSTPFSGGSTLHLTVGGVDIAAVGEVDLTTAGIYDLTPLTSWIGLPAGAVTATVAGASTGAATVVFEHGTSSP